MMRLEDFIPRDAEALGEFTRRLRRTTSNSGPRVVTLALEHIGEPYDRNRRHYRRRADQMRLGSHRWKQEQLYLAQNRRPWVAQILRMNPDGSLDRWFVKGLKDYTDANSTGTRGIRLYFHLEPGHIYEVRHFTSWTAEDRYFCRVEAGRVVRLEPSDVFAALPGGTRHA